MRIFVLLIASLLFTAQLQAKPLKVFVLAGQSNMQGHAKISTFEHIGLDPATKPMLAEMLAADGKLRVCERVWISSIGCAKDDKTEQTGKLTAGFGATPEKIGPEFTFGLYLEKFTDAPILLIKTSWGGKSLNTDFRSPSAGPYVFNETQLANFQKQGKDLAAMQAEKAKATGVYYRLMIEHVKAVLADLKRVVPGYDAAAWFTIAAPARTTIDDEDDEPLPGDGGAEERGLDQAVRHLEWIITQAHSINECRHLDVRQCDGRQHPGQHAAHVGDDRQHREHHDGRDQSRHHEIGHRIVRKGLQRVDLLGDAHGADLGRH